MENKEHTPIGDVQYRAVHETVEDGAVHKHFRTEVTPQKESGTWGIFMDFCAYLHTSVAASR